MENGGMVYEVSKKKAKSAITFAIAAMVTSVLYLIEGLASLALSVIPIPVFGFIIFIASIVIEFCLVAAIIVLIIMSFVNIGAAEKEMHLLTEEAEKDSITSLTKTSKILTFISIGLSVLVFVPVSVLNIIELILSFI